MVRDGGEMGWGGWEREEEGGWKREDRRERVRQRQRKLTVRQTDIERYFGRGTAGQTEKEMGLSYREPGNDRKCNYGVLPWSRK